MGVAESADSHDRALCLRVCVPWRCAGLLAGGGLARTIMKRQLDKTTRLWLWLFVLLFFVVLALLLLPERNDAPKGTYPHRAMPSER